MKTIISKTIFLCGLILLMSVNHMMAATYSFTVCQNGTVDISDSASSPGVWSALPGNPTVATITSPSTESTGITGLTTVGDYRFLYTATGLSDTFVISVQVSAPTPGLSLLGGCFGFDSLSLSGIPGATQITWYFNGDSLNTTPFPAYTIAGGNGSGSALNQLAEPSGIFVDRSGNVYTTEIGNDRVMMFPAGSTSATNGTIVAGGNGYGNGANQLRNPIGVFLDDSGYIYVADATNNRIQKFPPGSTSSANAVTVLNGLNEPTSVFVDAHGNVFVADQNNNQVVEYSQSSGIYAVVAGGNGQGSGANQLAFPWAVYLDSAGNIYVSDQDNNRIQKFPAGSTSATNGVTVAGGNGMGSAANQLFWPEGIYLDASGNIYVADYDNNRIQKFPPNSTSDTDGVTVAGGNGQGSAINQLYGPDAIFIDGSGNIYISDYWNNRVQEWKKGGIDSVYNPPAPGYYTANYILNNGCKSLLSDSVLVYPCGVDSTVWPGDADANHVVNNLDLLPIGLRYDSTGPARALADQGIVWQADTATNWTDTLPGYHPAVNYKNADCNGDGIINSLDTTAIAANYSLTHAKAANFPGPWRSGTPGFYLKMTPDTTYTGDTLTTDIYLGDSSLPASGIYGLAFTFNYDARVVDSAYDKFFFVNSWLGDSSNSINFNRNFYSTGQIEGAITGIDHTPRSGYGKIATLRCIITTDNINGKTWSYYTNRQYISDITAIDQFGNAIPLNAGIDSDYVAFFINGIREVNSSTLHIYPNPASSQVTISAGTAISDIRIIDIVGQPVLEQHGRNKQSGSVDISHIAPGVYTIHVSLPGGSATAKLVISR